MGEISDGAESKQKQSYSMHATIYEGIGFDSCSVDHERFDTV